MESPATQNAPMFGKYRLIAKIGDGGFGEVFKALDTEKNRHVALKVLHQGLMSDMSFINKAANEAHLIEKLNHPNIVKVYEVDQVSGRLYIAMEYIDGQPLSKVMAVNKNLTVQQKLNIITQIASALDATHAKKIVHRDVKPDNILVDNSGNIHLVDFGLAHAALSSIGQSSKSVGMGTAKYMSPEQAMGSSSGPAADIYSLGIIAYELFTGKTPFEADSLMGYMMAHKQQQPADPGRSNSGISREMGKVILKALSKQPNKRFKSAGAFARALENPPKQVKWGCIIPVVVSLMLITGGAFWFFLFGQEVIKDALGGASSASSRGTPISEILNSTAPVVPEADEPTAAPTAFIPTDIPAKPADTPTLAKPTNTAAAPEPAAAQAVVLPTAAPTEDSSPLEELIGKGVSVEQTGESSGSEKGKLIFMVNDGNGQPVSEGYIRVYSQKKDLSGNWVIDRELYSDSLSNAGTAEFDLDSGNFIVRANFYGYNWGTAGDVKGQADVPVQAGQVTRVRLSLGILTVGFLQADKTVLDNKYVKIWTQKKDIAGNWVAGDEVNSYSTDNTGTVSFLLSPGHYLIASDLPGYNWGTATDRDGMASVAVRPGQTSQVIVNLGQLVIGLTDASGQPIKGKYVKIYTQKPDAAGYAAPDGTVFTDSTDNSGQVVYNLTPGLYAMKIDDQIIYNIPVESGKITRSDGSSFSAPQ